MVENILIVAGSDIPEPTGVSDNFQFETFDFKSVESVALNSVPSDEQLKAMMSGKTTLLRLHTIAETGGLDTAGENIIVSPSDAEKLNQMPCCIVSYNGSIIPQIIVPSDSVNIADNGLMFADDLRENCLAEGGYTWLPERLESDSEEADELSSYGKRDVKQVNTGYVSMDGCAKTSLDNPIISSRRFTCDTTTTSAKNGSCAICYHFTAYNGSADGETAEEKGVTPQLIISLNDSTGEKAIVISVPPNGNIIARVGDDVSSGSLEGIQTSILPPHIVKEGNDWNMQPLYMYPLYSGFVISNNATRSGKSSDNGLFIPYSNIKDAISAIKINGVDKSPEMTQLISIDENEMQFFPTLFQESATPESIRLEVDSANRIKMGNTVSLQWLKSYGRFSYCPIYFHRKVHFTFYFKGEYVEEGRLPDSKHIFYPIACANLASGVSHLDWSGINGDGASPVEATFVCSDHTLQESIYKVEIKMNADMPQRYPIEIFGCVKVNSRSEHPYTTKNGNGEFVFANQFQPQFSWLHSNRYSDSGKNYLDLMTELSVQMSLDSVGGSLDLDAFPLERGIDEIKLPQSIGQLNLKVHGDNKNIFTGYGMELKSNVSESLHTIGLQLEGVQKKLEDIKLANAPFWDGDRLQAICAYFESYANVKLKMVNYQTTSIANALSVGNSIKGSTGTWKSNRKTIVNSTSVSRPDFRVPHSVDWRSPAVDFQNGTSCLEALDKLAELTSCVFSVQLDGIGYFYELNDFGIPYYVYNQDSSNIISFDASEVISVDISPYLENKYNCFITMGFLQKKDRKTDRVIESSVQMGLLQTLKDLSDSLVDYPWARAIINVENGFLTKSELGQIHSNNVKHGIVDVYQGRVTVKGNTDVNHLYQRVKICGVDFFVISIDHSINLGSKEWTTSYGLNAYDMEKV